MGCDGGTIPKRNEVVKKKEKKAKVDKDVELIYKWGYCAVSNQVLRRPIVSNNMGILMNKEGAIEHLIEYKDGVMKAAHLREDIPGLAAFNSMRDIKELNLKDTSSIKTANAQTADRQTNQGASTSSGNGDRSINGDVRWANFVCPITNLEMNGRYKFMFSWRCGCVVSERAIKEVSNDNKCLVCQKSYQPYDLVVLNPVSSKDFEDNEIAMGTRLVKRALKKRDLCKPEDGSSLQSSTATASRKPSPTKSTLEGRERVQVPRSKRHRGDDDRL